MQVQKVSNNNANKSFGAKYLVKGTRDEIAQIISRAQQRLARQTTSRLMLDYGPDHVVLFGTDDKSVKAIQEFYKKLHGNFPSYTVTPAYKSFLKLPLDKKLEQIFGDGAKDVKQYEAKNILGPFDYMKGMIRKGLDINEATIKYIAENVPKKDLPEIASAFGIFQQSKRKFSFDVSEGHLVANITEESHPIARYIEGTPTERLTYEETDRMKLFGRWIEGKNSIADVIRQCLSSLEDNAYTISQKHPSTVDYTQRFEKYI